MRLMSPKLFNRFTKAIKINGTFIYAVVTQRIFFTNYSNHEFFKKHFQEKRNYYC